MSAFRRVDPVQGYPLALDFEGVAVDHPGGAGHDGKGWRGEEDKS